MEDSSSIQPRRRWWWLQRREGAVSLHGQRERLNSVARTSPSVQNYRTRALFPNGRGKSKPRETGSCVSHPRAGLPDPVEAAADCPSPRWRRRKPDIPVPYLYFDMGAAVLCASFMSFGVKRRWFALGAALQLAVSTYAAYVGGYVHYGDWLKVRMYSRTVAIIGGFLVLASGAGELYRRKPRSRSLQSTGQVFLGIYLICVAYSLQHSKEDRLAYLNHLPGGELMVQLFFLLYGILALAFLSGYYVTLAAQILAVLLPPVMLLIDGNVAYWHHTRRVEFWNQMKLLGESVGIFGAAVILATDG